MFFSLQYPVSASRKFGMPKTADCALTSASIGAICLLVVRRLRDVRGHDQQRGDIG